MSFASQNITTQKAINQLSRAIIGYAIECIRNLVLDYWKVFMKNV